MTKEETLILLSAILKFKHKISVIKAATPQEEAQKAEAVAELDLVLIKSGVSPYDLNPLDEAEKQIDDEERIEQRKLLRQRQWKSTGQAICINDKNFQSGAKLLSLTQGKTYQVRHNFDGEGGMIVVIDDTGRSYTVHRKRFEMIL